MRAVILFALSFASCAAADAGMDAAAGSSTAAKPAESEANRGALLLRPTAWTPQTTDSVAHLRGLIVVDDRVAWASGAQGTVLRTVDGGATWEVYTIVGAEALDFRDVHAVSARIAWVISAGEPARIYQTLDGAKSFELIYENVTTGVFFDAMSFWDPDHGIAFSDPIDNSFLVIQTANGGQNWQPIPRRSLPIPLSGEAGFAGSGTCLCVFGDSHVWIGTGGTAARILRSIDKGASWEAVETPMAAGADSNGAGIFSVAFVDSKRGIIVGGDYTKPTQQAGNAAYSDDGGKTWTRAVRPPGGFRSGAAYVATSVSTYVAVGTTGSDFSLDGGRTWQPFGETGYNAVAFSPSGRFGLAAGDGGRIARCELEVVE